MCNGRQACLALITHFEGDAQQDQVKDKAYAAIAAAKYYGEKKKFPFEIYVMIHQEAYADLEQYDEQVCEEKRVQDLLMGIKDNSPAANTAKGTILCYCPQIILFEVLNVFFVFCPLND